MRTETERVNAVGRPIDRVDGLPKSTGSAEYTTDARPPGLLYGRVLRSPYPHARIRSIDTSRAEALGGVHAVLTKDSKLGVAWYEDSTLFPDTVRFAGDEVAAVAAETEAIANDALALIDVDYELLPFDVELVHAAYSGSRNVAEPVGASPNEEPKVTERGDPGPPFEQAAHRVDQVYETPPAVHNSLEPHGSTANWEGENLTIWDSTQAIFAVQRGVADALGPDLHRVRVLKQYMGGGFGAKQIPWKNAAIAALLARESQRPVTVILDREAENVAVGHRNETNQRVRLACGPDGRLTSISARILQGVGAYNTGGEASDTATPYHLFYRCENVRTEQVAVKTNIGPAVAFRAPGYAEAAFALESAMDELALMAGIDPFEFRLRNLPEEDQTKGLPYSSPGSMKAVLERLRWSFGWDSFESRKSGEIRRGKGMACQVWGGSGFPPAHAMVRWMSDGTVTVVCGTQDIGTGSRTSLAQLAADALCVDVADVRVLLGDTTYPYAPTSAGSATLASAGPAVLAAAADARQKALAHAADLLHVAPGDLQYESHAPVIRALDGRQLTVAEVLRDIAPGELIGIGEREPNAEDVSIKSFGAQAAEVEVDMLTGEIRVVRIMAGQDSGLVVNPTLYRSQMLGGITQGLGFALMEHQVVDRRLGKPLNANLEEYVVPTIMDSPRIEILEVGTPDRKANTTSAKGIGEPPIIGTAAAIANAVFDATGLRIRSLPITRKRVLDAIREEAAQ